MKCCRECGVEKPLSSYYKHAQMLDGYLNKCKECVKTRVKVHRGANLQKIQEYDRNRPNHRERIVERCKMAKMKRATGDVDFIERDRKRSRDYSDKYPEKRKAQCAVSNAIRDGKLVKPSACEHCGLERKLQGHHWSYLEQHRLDVIWLCVRCHNNEHKRLNAIGRDPDNIGG